MSTEQEKLAGDEARDRKFEVDRTPTGVVRQGLSTLARSCLPARADALRILDPCAGSGVFSQVARQVWTRALHITGIEIREEERPWLTHHCDEVVIGDVLDEVAKLDNGSLDVVVGNPAFSLTADLLRALEPKMADGGTVMLLGLNDLGTRGRHSREAWQDLPPFYKWRIGGTLKFRAGVNPKTGKRWTCDMRSYSWWIWRVYGGHVVPREIDGARAIAMSELPVLAAKQRRWTIPPGREEVLDVQ